jgi:hypothetical protein
MNTSVECEPILSIMGRALPSDSSLSRRYWVVQRNTRSGQKLKDGLRQEAVGLEGKCRVCLGRGPVNDHSGFLRDSSACVMTVNIEWNDRLHHSAMSLIQAPDRRHCRHSPVGVASISSPIPRSRPLRPPRLHRVLDDRFHSVYFADNVAE